MTEANYFKLGLFILAALAISVAGVIVLGGGEIFRTYVYVETYLDESVTGLSVGSEIQHRGVPIGKVDEVTFVHREYQGKLFQSDQEPTKALDQYFDLGRLVLVRAKIDARYFRDAPERGAVRNGEMSAETDRELGLLVDRGLRVRMASNPLTGVAYLDVDYVDPERYPVPEIFWEPRTYYIPSVPSTIMRLQESVGEILLNLEDAEIDKIGQDLRLLVNTIGGKLNEMDFSNADDLVAELRETNRQIQRLLVDPRVDSAIADVSAAASHLRGIVESSDARVDAILADFSKIGANIGRGSEEVPELILRLNKELRRLDRLLAENRPDVDEIFDNLRQASRDLKELVSNAKKYPSHALFGKPPPPTAPAEK